VSARAARCGNDPRGELSDGDKAAVEEFEAFLAERARVAAEFGVRPEQITLRGCSGERGEEWQ